MAELQTQGFDIDLSEEIAQGNYSNLAIIAHSTSEFIIDFAAMLPGLKKAKVKSRVILTPEHAKRLLFSLQENIKIPQPHAGEDPVLGLGMKSGKA